MLFKVESIKTVEVSKEGTEDTSTWMTIASDRDGNKLLLTAHAFSGFNIGDELELKKRSGQSTIKDAVKKDD